MNVSQTMVVVIKTRNVSIQKAHLNVYAMRGLKGTVTVAPILMSAQTIQRFAKMDSVSTIQVPLDVNVKWVSCIQMRETIRRVSVSCLMCVDTSFKSLSICRYK